MIQTQDIMTRKLVTTSPDEPLYRAHDFMKRNAIRHLPVADKMGKIIGMLSDRDVQRAMIIRMVEAPEGSTSEALVQDQCFHPGSSVGEYMHSPVRTFQTSDSLRSVVDCMLSEKISSVLISKNGQIAGILTTDDLLRVLRTKLDDSLEDARVEVGTVFDPDLLPFA